jgi:hypothetical protein
MRRTALCLGIVFIVLAAPAARAELGMGISIGGYTGDRLYTAGSAQPQRWYNATGEEFLFGDELLVDLESWAQFGLNGWTTLTDRLGLRFDIAFTDVDVDGKVRDSSGASDTLAWDQWFILDLLAQATWRLGRSTDNYPYLALGPGLSVISSEGDTLGQVAPGIVYGAGWRISADRGSFLELFARGQLQWPDFGDEEARLASDSFDSNSPISALSAGVTVGYVF